MSFSLGLLHHYPDFSFLLNFSHELKFEVYFCQKGYDDGEDIIEKVQKSESYNDIASAIM